MKIAKARAISTYERDSELLWLAKQASTKNVIAEIGSWRGCTARAMSDNTTGILYCIDTWNGGTDEDLKKEVVANYDCWANIQAEFRRNLQDDYPNKVHAIIQSSLDAAMQFNKENILFDMIFIDASHDYDNAKADILAWEALLRTDGLLCGHDYSPDFPGVMKAVEECIPNNLLRVNGVIWYQSATELL